MPEIRELLKEHEWDKEISKKVKKLIDERIVVLNQNYQEEQERKGGFGGNEVAGKGAAQSDGTQIRPYVNNVIVKVAKHNVINEMQVQKGRKTDYFE